MNFKEWLKESGYDNLSHDEREPFKIGWYAALDSQWQPIETVPTDGTVILVSDVKYVNAAYWGGTRPPCLKGAGHHCSITPQTHWMPLPKPPAKGEL